jgi:hypothetical protein
MNSDFRHRDSGSRTDAFAAILIIAVMSLIHLTACSSLALAQDAMAPPLDSSRPIEGGTTGMRIPTETPTFGPSADSQILRHRGPTGAPCLAVGAYARPHIIDQKLYDHVIVAVNSCAQRIAMQVCYYRSQDCIPMEVPGGERKEAILGTMPAEKDFRFEFREKF